ncbi:hypothetical protein [Acinetobacter larvae]|uniref:Uncharacterized protein n=1 Tax=Acinetobacter larvae TaxID=1789224 RepID=A0A1B2LXA7_9GAMM|nr:hypothetical protein [Acinetobacter larvae]AOA57577.1 hypothetical protein BFG52_03885 [Acinetobacter larvae]
MKQQCIDAVEQAIGRKLRVNEAQDIEAKIIEAKKSLARGDRAKWQQMTENERLLEASKIVGMNALAEVKRKNMILANDILTQNRNLEILKDQNHKLPVRERVDRMVANYGDMSGIQSIDSKAHAIASIYRGALVDLYTNIKGAMGLYTDKDMVNKVVRELFKQDTGDATAKKIAEKMSVVFEDMRVRFNRSGGDVGKLDDFGMPQTHSSEKLLEAGRDKWVDFAFERINREKYVNEDGSLYSDQQIKDLLEYAYQTIVTNGANKLEVGRQNTGGGTSKVTNKHSEGRVLHFKDADAWMDYQAEFGGMPFVDVIEAHITGLSKDIALVENLGSNPKNAMRILMDSARKLEAEQGIETKKTDKTLNRAQAMFDEFMGANRAESEVLANVGLAYRSMNVASMLGGTTLSSVTDQAMTAKTAAVHGIAYRKVFGELVKNLNPKNKEDRELAHSLGLATQEMLGSIARWSDDGLTSVHGKAAKLATASNAIATTVMRASGLNALTAANKIAFSKMMMDKYGRLTRDKAWNDLHESDRKLLKSASITEQDWQVWRLAKPVEDASGNQLLSARSIYEIPDSQLTQFGDPAKIKDEMATRLQAHIMDEQGMAVLEAGLRERSMMNVGKRGSAMGEITRSMLQFKSFPMSFLMRHGARAMAQDSFAAKAWYAGSLLGMTTLLGGLVVQLKELANGNDPADMTEGDFYKRAFVAGGGLPILGDILVAGTDTSGRDAADFMIGPLGSDLNTLLKVSIGNATKLANGTETNSGNEIFKAVKNKIPAQNLWYTKAVTNRMIFDNIQDVIAPGYREKLQRKAERQQGRTRWWGDDLSDIQAPDFAKAVGN